MRILQDHADWIEYEPIEKEIKSAEEVEKKKVRLENILVLFTSVEVGDSEELGKRAMDEAKEFLGKLKANRVVIYPFAHLSSSLAKPNDALKVLKSMEEYSKSLNIETYRAPFGWNKKLSISVKGHPLAEQSRVYAPGGKIEAKVGAEHKKAQKIIIDRKDLPPNDHRILGQDLKIFTFADEVGAGLPLWMPNGEMIKYLLQDFMRRMEQKYGYKYVSTPVITKGELYEKTGHLPYYKDSMYPPIVIEDEDYYLKPMNCPHHHMIFKQLVISYKDLPLRLAEAGTTYRKELSGVVYGLIRVMGFCQNDAHLYVTREQLKGEFIKVLQLLKEVYEILGITGYWFRLSLPDFKGNPEKFTGDPQEWEFACEEIRSVMREFGQKFVEEKGEAAFYGPKIDVQIKNTLGKEETIATSQVDIVVPKRLGLSYVDSDGSKKNVIVIHRAVLGSYERFIAYLLEQTKGSMPVWLAPVQVMVMSISDEVKKYAEAVTESLRGSGIRAELDEETKTMQHKIRDAQMQKIPLMVIVGKKEEESNSLAVRTREGKVEYGVNSEDFVKRIKDSVKEFK